MWYAPMLETMPEDEALRIVSVDKFKRFMVIGFSDGRMGRFSVELLHAMLPQTEELFESKVLGDFDEPDGLIPAAQE